MGFLTPNAAGEHAVLRTFALQQLPQMRTTVAGLTDEQAHAAPTVSELNLSGLLLHTAAVGVYWSASAAAAPAQPELDALVPVPPAPWHPEDLTHWKSRWCLAHIAAEVARHAGHADIIRETLDGKGAFELNGDAGHD